MGVSTYLTQQQRIQSRLGDSSSATLARIKDLLNEAYLELLEANDWPWMRYTGNLALVAAYTTGTVSVTAGTTEISLTGGTWSTGWSPVRVRLPSGTVYDVSITGATTGTLGRAAVTTETAVAYTLYRDVYSTAARMRSIISAHMTTQDGYPVKIVTPDVMAAMKSAPPLVVDPVTHISFVDVDSNMVSQVEVFPIPLSVGVIWFTGYRQVAPLTQDGDTYQFPQHILPVYQSLATYKALKWRGRYAEAAAELAMYQREVAQSIAKASPDAGAGERFVLDPKVFRPVGWMPVDGRDRFGR